MGFLSPPFSTISGRAQAERKRRSERDNWDQNLLPVFRSPSEELCMESADAEAAGPGVEQERPRGEEDPRHSRDFEAGVPPVAMEDHTTAPAQPRTCHNIMEVSGMLNAVLKSETDTETLTVKQRILHTERRGCSPAPSSKYLLHGNLSSRTVHSHPNPSQPLETDNDPSCSYATEMDAGNMLFGLETPTDLSRGDRNQYSSSSVLNSNDMARDQAQRGGATSGGSKEKLFLCVFCKKGFSSPQKVENHQREASW
ncbi:uncharacterized protein LOC115191590 [Salmo trutta]|uniref:uncharacterized protein LOC115191590 n=1 Tax=Salmo trutta TaxID=8032 RepID=UPI0011313CCE|nr:uncharacterized protein LOC115191590 [Salmo trutta]